VKRISHSPRTGRAMSPSPAPWYPAGTAAVTWAPPERMREDSRQWKTGSSVHQEIRHARVVPVRCYGQ
jgi:hypothetical protein